MRKILNSISLCLLLVGLSVPAQAEYRDVATTISADIPSDFIYRYISNSKSIYYSPDDERKTG